ncbi:MAG: endonuclease [Bacteroidetes bacterium]|nr:endonuclease [Bacteroidota bacterium]
MWYLFSINQFMKGAFALLLLSFSLLTVAKEPSKHVILITIDGMRPEMVTDSLMPSPNLKMMRRNGMFVNRIKGIVPTATYPSHTTIVTGVKPVEHQIYYNSPFTDNHVSSVSYWYADSIKSPTIWEVASKNGLSVSSLFWPVSVGSKYIQYNIPEFWSNAPVDNQLDFIKPYCTPLGLLDELEREATGKLSQETFGAGSMNRDARTAYMANYILNKYKPNLMTIHLITTDYAQHATGLNSDRVKAAVSSADNAIGLIIENLQQTKMMDSTTIIVCGDHGFTNSYRNIAPNVWLVQEGLLSEQPEGDWKACFHGSGAMMFLYLKDISDKITLAKVRKKLASLPESTRSMFRVVDKKELEDSGCDPKVALAIEPIQGVAVATNRTGADVIEKFGGKHGYLSGIDPTTLVAFGCGIDRKEVPLMNQTEIAPFTLKLLGLDFKKVTDKK